jgi:hypothetical protein
MKLKVNRKTLRNLGRIGKKLGLQVAKIVGKKTIDYGLTKGGQALGTAAGSYLLGPEAGPEGGVIGAAIGHETAGVINQQF